MIKALLQIFIVGLLVTGCNQNTEFTIRNSTNGQAQITTYDQDKSPINTVTLDSGQQFLHVNKSNNVHFVTVKAAGYNKNFIISDILNTMEKRRRYILLVSEEDAIFMSYKDLRKNFKTY